MTDKEKVELVRRVAEGWLITASRWEDEFFRTRNRDLDNMARLKRGMAQEVLGCLGEAWPTEEVT